MEFNALAKIKMTCVNMLVREFNVIFFFFKIQRYYGEDVKFPAAFKMLPKNVKGKILLTSNYTV